MSAAQPSNVFVSCSVEQLLDDLAALDEQEAMVMIEIDGTSRQIRGIRRDAYCTPDGHEVPVVTLVGHDVPRAQQQ